jgi:hypothetical protein
MFGNVRTSFTILALASMFFVCIASADPDSNAAQRAGDLFDKGVQEFSAANYGPATRTFLNADALVRNVRAVLNALASARESKDPLLMAAAAERALAHGDLPANEAARARDELAVATRQLARLELDCAPEPTSIAVDGDTVTPGVVYAVPGAHDVTCEGTGQHARAHVSCEAGALCRVALQLQPAPSGAPTAVPSDSAKSFAPHRSMYSASRSESRESVPKKKPFSPVVFVAGAVITAGFTGVTVWSGIEAISAKNRYTSDADAYDSNEVRRDARRTDFLLAGTLVCAGATAALGLWFVDWGSRPRAKVSWSPGGGSLAVEGRF